VTTGEGEGLGVTAGEGDGLGVTTGEGEGLGVITGEGDGLGVAGAAPMSNSCRHGHSEFVVMHGPVPTEACIGLCVAVYDACDSLHDRPW